MAAHAASSPGSSANYTATTMAATVATAAAAATAVVTMAASYCEPTISMEELIGDMPDVECTSGTVTVKGLKVRWWKYGPL